MTWESACSKGFEGLICGELLLQMRYMYVYMCSVKAAQDLGPNGQVGEEG
jgi:hypothetical protein